MHVFVACLTNGRSKSFAGDSRNRGLARGVDVQQDQYIGLIESPAELIPEVLCARKPMRLKEHEYAVELAAAGGLEGGANFRRMMAVVVNYRDVVYDAFDVEAAADACKFSEAFANQIAGNVQVERDRRGGRGVADVVYARGVRQIEQAEILAFERETELTAESFQFHVADDQVGLARRAVGDDRALHVRKNGLHVGFVQAKNHGAIKRDAVHEL